MLPVHNIEEVGDGVVGILLRVVLDDASFLYHFLWSLSLYFYYGV